MKKIKVADDKYIVLSLIDENMEVVIKYSKQSTLKKRLILLNKLRELLYKL